MDELFAIAKVVGMTGGGTALLVWSLRGAIPLAFDGWKAFLEWRLKVQAQSAEIGVKRDEALARREATFHAEQQQTMAALQSEIAKLRSEVEDWMGREHKCRDEVHSLRNEVHTLNIQYRVVLEANKSLAAKSDKGDTLLRNLERNHPEWFV